MLYIEDDHGLSPRNLSPVVFDLGKGHKSEGDAENHQPTSPSQVEQRLRLAVYVISLHS